MATQREILNELTAAAMECYDEVEARQVAEMIVTTKGGITRNALIVEPTQELNIEGFDIIKEQLKSWRPVQYILGSADFMDMSFEVNESVLIPRPETEELVMWVAENAPSGATILDACTGSGCIAIALARTIRDSHIHAFDLYDNAIAVAKRNAARHAPQVNIIKGDALADFSVLFNERFDAVVSNPPYIPHSDSALMRPNVTDYEPHEALFVDDSDPLIFYRAIAQTSRKILKDNGLLYFEIYESLGAEMCAMLRCEGYTDIILREDFRGKPRMICAKASSIVR